jgi:hypothetical protein
MNNAKINEKSNEQKVEQQKTGEKLLTIRTGIRGGLAVTLMID